MENITFGQYALVYNAFSFTIAVMGAATAFFVLGRSTIAPTYRTAISLTALVTGIAFYHYFRIFDSWSASYAVVGTEVKPSGVLFNDAYRYVDWLLTVPLLLIELILVMRLSTEESTKKSVRLASLAALMVILGYPGEISSSAGTRWFWWAMAMIPFIVIVYDLFVGLKASISSQPENVRGLVSAARWVTILSWCFYPVVYVFPMIGFSGGGAETAVQVGYTIADIVSKAAFGVLIYTIALRKSEVEKFSPIMA